MKNNYFGNRNAEKEIKKDTSIHIRIEKFQKELFQKAAKEKGLTVSKWIISLAEKEIKK